MDVCMCPQHLCMYDCINKATFECINIYTFTENSSACGEIGIVGIYSPKSITHRWSWLHECGWAALCRRCWPCAGRGLGIHSRVPGACGAGHGPWRTRHPSQTEPSPPAHKWSHGQLSPILEQKQRGVPRSITETIKHIKTHCWTEIGSPFNQQMIESSSTAIEWLLCWARFTITTSFNVSQKFWK